MSQVNNELLKQVVDGVVEALHPQQIYLFGSQATGKTHKHSDLDLFVIVDDEVNGLHELAGRGYIAISRMGIPVDLVLHRRRSVQKWASVKFSVAYEATHKGTLVYAA